jgi:hypothetical protein
MAIRFLDGFLARNWLFLKIRLIRQISGLFQRKMHDLKRVFSGMQNGVLLEKIFHFCLPIFAVKRSPILASFIMGNADFDFLY